jgi:hypothetical protein
MSNTLRNIKDHGRSFEEKSLLGPLTEEEFLAWCQEDEPKTWVEKYLDHLMPGELDNLSDEEIDDILFPRLGEEDFF